MPSTVIAKIEYLAAQEILRIVFHSGAVYEYLQVPESVYTAMKQYREKGVYLNKFIKGKYSFRKIGGHENYIQVKVLTDHSLKATIMPDNKTNTGKQDDIRVDSNDASEVEYLHRQFPSKTHEEIKEAIRKAGPMRADIIRYLQGK